VFVDNASHFNKTISTAFNKLHANESIEQPIVNDIICKT